jgi:hypothetical protein
LLAGVTPPESVEVEDDEVVPLRQGVAQTQGAVPFGGEAVAVSRQGAGHGAGKGKFVFDYEDAHGERR